MSTVIILLLFGVINSLSESSSVSFLIGFTLIFLDFVFFSLCFAFSLILTFLVSILLLSSSISHTTSSTDFLDFCFLLFVLVCS
jgi:hypothetical protein